MLADTSVATADLVGSSAVNSCIGRRKVRGKKSRFCAEVVDEVVAHNTKTFGTVPEHMRATTRTRMSLNRGGRPRSTRRKKLSDKRRS